MTTTPQTPIRLTSADVVKLYRAGTAATRVQLRAAYPRMALEFDAIDREQDRLRRIKERA